jgi:hypothetical protein
MNQCPIHPPRPWPSDPGELDIISLIVVHFSNIEHTYILDHRTFVMVIYSLRLYYCSFLSLCYFQHYLGAAVALPHCTSTCNLQSHRPTFVVIRWTLIKLSYLIMTTNLRRHPIYH